MDKTEFEETLQQLAKAQDSIFRYRSGLLEIENSLAQIELTLSKMAENTEESA